MLDRLDRRLPVLIATAPGAPPRHQTLQATLDWSYDLLEPRNKTCSSASASLSAASTSKPAIAVCAPVDGGDLGVTSGLATLSAASLLRQVEQPTGEMRFEMLETVRDYAAQRLRRTPETVQLGILRSHADYFLTLAETADAELGGTRTQSWFARLAAEHGNLRAALDWLTEQRDLQAALQLAASLWRFWQVHGYLTEGRAFLERLLMLDAGAPVTRARARALVGAGALAWRQQDVAHARQRLLQATEECRSVDEPAALATASKFLGLVALHAEPPDFVAARRLLEESLVLRRRLADRDGIASCLNDLAVVALRSHDYASARPLLEESEAVCRALGNRYGLSFVLNNLSLVALARDDFPARGRHARGELAARARAGQSGQRCVRAERGSVSRGRSARACQCRAPVRSLRSSPRVGGRSAVGDRTRDVRAPPGACPRPLAGGDWDTAVS